MDITHAAHNEGLLYALDDQQKPRRISDFCRKTAPCAPSDARLTCPHCGGRLSQKHGMERVHHYFHLPSQSGAPAKCPAASGEGAAHLNAKMGLLIRLRMAAERSEKISVSLLCNTQARHRRAPQPLISLSPSHSIEAEVWVPDVGTRGRRPDLVIAEHGVPCLFVEVFWSHGVSQQKAAEFAQRSIPTVELDVDDINRELDATKPLVLLPRSILAFDGEHTQCDVCTPTTSARRLDPARSGRAWTRQNDGFCVFIYDEQPSYYEHFPVVKAAGQLEEWANRNNIVVHWIDEPAHRPYEGALPSTPPH